MRVPSIRIFVTTGLMAAAAVLTAAETNHSAFTTSGKSFQANPVGIDGEWSVTFAAQGQQRTLAKQELAFWGAYSEHGQGTQTLTADGSVIVADIVELGAENSKLESPLWRDAVLPRQVVRAILFAPRPLTLARDLQIQTLVDEELHDDAVLLTNGDRILGKLLSSTAESGGAGLFGLETLTIEANESRRLTFQPHEVVSVSFARGTRAFSRPECLLGFRDGTRLAARSITSRGELLEVELAAGGRLMTPAGSFWKELTWIQPLNNGVDYLSDFSPLSYRSQPFLDLEWPLGVDRNVLGGRLRCQGNVYLKGLGMHSAARVVYELPRGYSRFEAEIAMDDQAGHMGSVVCRVFTATSQDGRDQWQLSYTSPTIRGGEPPLPLSVDMSRASKIALLVEFADRGDVLDHANWLNARLLR